MNIPSAAPSLPVCTKTIYYHEPKHQAKLKAHEARQARQARRVINGIFIGLIVLMILFLLCYYFFFG